MTDAITRDDVEVIFRALFDAHVKLDEILQYLYDEDDGEEEETDPA